MSKIKKISELINTNIFSFIKKYINSLTLYKTEIKSIIDIQLVFFPSKNLNKTSILLEETLLDFNLKYNTICNSKINRILFYELN